MLLNNQINYFNMKEELIQHLKEIQRMLQIEKGYSEVNGNNDLVAYYNENWDKNYEKDLNQIKNDFFHLCLVFKSISSYSNQGHWRKKYECFCCWEYSAI